MCKSLPIIFHCLVFNNRSITSNNTGTQRSINSNKVYKAKKQLAAIDWNFHVNLEAATTKTGNVIVTRKYNQHTKEWNSKVVKVKKKYDYIPLLMGKILRARREDEDIITRQVSLNEGDPALLVPTIAATLAPSSKELFLARKSRFKASDD